MKELYCKLAAVLALAVYAPSVLLAGGWQDAARAGRESLGFYLERAMVQTDQSRFEKIAQEGIGAALFEWERASEETALF